MGSKGGSRGTGKNTSNRNGNTRKRNEDALPNVNGAQIQTDSNTRPPATGNTNSSLGRTHSSISPYQNRRMSDERSS